MKDMATSTIKYDGDTSWHNGTTTQSAPIKYRLRNGICYITAEYSGQLTINDTPRTVMTLPEGYRPSTQIYGTLINRASAGGGTVIINLDGTIVLRHPPAATAYFDFTVAYPVK